MEGGFEIRVRYASGRNHLETNLTMDDFLKVTSQLVDRAVSPIYEALDKASLKPEDIDLVILAGGSSQLPQVSEKIEEIIGKRPRKIPRHLMMAVAYGAALYQKEVFSLPKANKRKKILGDSLGMQVDDGGRRTYKLLLNHNEELPATAEFDFPLDEGQMKATIQLVSMEGNTDHSKRALKQRTLDLKYPASSIHVKISVDENRLIQLVAYDPNHPENQSIIEVNSRQITEAKMKELRTKLGLKDFSSIPAVNGLQQCIGIDLGTTTSEMAIASRSLDDKRLTELLNPAFNVDSKDYALYCFPSVVYFQDGFENIHVADLEAIEANGQQGEEQKVFSSFKTKSIIKPLAIINGQEVDVEKLSALVLAKIWEAAQNRQGNNNMTSAVVTVPAAFTPDQCEVTYNAAKIAGIQDVTLIDEPTAAFYYYRYMQELDLDRIRNVMVFDFGGGTTDVAILDVGISGESAHDYKDSVYRVLSTAGDPNCGGKEINEILYSQIKNAFENEHSCKMAAPACRKLQALIEEAKVELSNRYEEEHG